MSVIIFNTWAFFSLVFLVVLSIVSAAAAICNEVDYEFWHKLREIWINVFLFTLISPIAIPTLVFIGMGVLIIDMFYYLGDRLNEWSNGR